MSDHTPTPAEETAVETAAAGTPAAVTKQQLHRQMVDEGVADRERIKSVVPLFRRQRIREATEQVHAVVVERVQHARTPADLATFAGLAAEVAAVARARRGVRVVPGDVRATLISVAASAILLAEEADRPAEPKAGQKRAATKRWKPTRFPVPA